MGLNISGFIINRNLKNEIATVADCLNVKLRLDEESDFETATRTKYKTADIEFMHTEKGTLAFWDDDYFQGTRISNLTNENTEGFIFRFSETAMVFMFEHFRGEYGDRLWITYDDGFTVNMRHSEGVLRLKNKEIKVVENRDVVFDIFSEVMQELIGVTFNTVDFGAITQRYKVSK
ncbi:hypothetical protein OAF63_01095 [Saprospiraceae bacterium]|jgi:hypothetical protein|nr:hypothetical protein [Saprospiraceae bacterium]MDF1863736.1 hypothetical protein [Saprospiraceae bacterium]